MSKTILILGASWSGLTVTHKLLKQTLNTLKDYHIILVSPTTHLYCNLAAVRGIIPGGFTDGELFADFRPGLKQYSASSFEFVQGSASSLDPESKSVTIKTESGEKTQSYDVLILATGSRYIGDTPWKSYLSGTDATIDALHKLQEQVKNATSIVIGGAGPTGVETACELGAKYGTSKKITLVTAGKEVLLGAVPTKIARGAESVLTKRSVEIIKGVRIEDAKTADGTTTLTLDNGETIATDLYISTTGILPNSEFIPKTLLNEKGFVVVDEFLRVKGATDMWAVGDINHLEYPQLIYAAAQAAALYKNVDLVLKGKEPKAYAEPSDGNRFIVISLGPNKGTGRSGSWKLPGLAVWWFKCRYLLTDRVPGIVAGTASP